MVTGNIHSIESFGTVDGPGIRFVVFVQGCPLRCKYCHNVDTRSIGTGKEISSEQIIAELTDYRPFIRASGGGITVSGGEPLLQMPFLTELFRLCKTVGVHTAIDTSGGCYVDTPRFHRVFDELAKYTDLILLDLKEIDPEKHKWLTGVPNQRILAFARYLSDKKIPVWIRHVLVPGVTDSESDLIRLGAFVATLSNVERVDILPYHRMGIYKWQALGLKYELDKIDPPSEQDIKRARRLLRQNLRKDLVTIPE